MFLTTNKIVFLKDESAEAIPKNHSVVDYFLDVIEFFVLETAEMGWMTTNKR